MFASTAFIPVIALVFSKGLLSIPRSAIVGHLHILAVVVMGTISEVLWSAATDVSYTVRITDRLILFLIAHEL